VILHPPEDDEAVTRRFDLVREQPESAADPERGTSPDGAGDTASRPGAESSGDAAACAESRTSGSSRPSSSADSIADAADSLISGAA